MSSDHGSFIQTPMQLVVVATLALIIPIAISLVAASLVMTATKSSSDPEAVLQRIKPVGEVRLAEPSGPKGMLTGEQVYAQVCATCHASGIAGAHKLGDKAAWAKILAQGQSAAVKNAIGGIRAMPARGGNPDLTDAEVERAVVHMANQSGAAWKEPAAAAVAATVTPAAPAAARTGEQVVQAACGKCHQTGAGGAPKVGDKAAWTKRLKGGIDATVAAAIQGHGGMPARGGFADLTDAEVRSAIVHMFQSGGVTVAAAATSTAAAPPPASAAAASPLVAATPDGKKAYDAACAVCHSAGIAGAPKTGDKAAWAARIKSGVEALYQSALKGKGAMPAKGGNTSLSDAEVKAAVDYQLAQSR